MAESMSSVIARLDAGGGMRLFLNPCSLLAIAVQARLAVRSSSCWTGTWKLISNVLRLGYDMKLDI
jgi:hypothetical protein